MTRMP